HPTLEERSVVDRQVHRETDGRRGKDPKEQPALPVGERAGRPEDEEDKDEGPERSLNNRLSVKPIHIEHPTGTIVAAIRSMRSERTSSETTITRLAASRSDRRASHAAPGRSTRRWRPAR